MNARSWYTLRDMRPIILIALCLVTSVQVAQAAASTGILILSKHADAAATLYTVTSTGDGDDINIGDGVCADANGDCTLRAAIQEANAILGDDTVDFDIPPTDPGFDGTTYTIGLTKELPDITDGLTIIGLGADELIIIRVASDPFRIFTVTTTGAVTFFGMTITGGDANVQEGGGIENAGSATVSVTSCIVTANSASLGGGGGIANASTGIMNIAGTTISNNSTDTLVGGGIINVSGTLTINNCTVAGNSAGLEGGGLSTFGNTTVNNCTISNNSAGSGGGGIDNSGSLTVTGTTFSNNFTYDQAPGSGGGLWNESQNSSAEVTGCTFVGNIAGRFAGGGIYISGGSFILTNSTLSGNTTNGDAFSGGSGGGVDVVGIESGKEVKISNCTIVGNSSPDGSGINNEDGSTISVQSCIVALNTSGSDPIGRDAIGAFISGGFNLIGVSDGSTGFDAATDLTGTSAMPLNPKLDPSGLQDNGGPTQTIALMAGSPAIDQGISAGLTTDQRGTGFPRTFDQPGVTNAVGGDGTDIGAFELETVIPSTLANISTRDEVETGDNVLISGFIIAGSATKQVLLRGIGPSLTVSGALADPTLELHDASGNLIGFNDNWQTNANAQDIIDTGIAPPDPLEAALLVSLDPAAYTAIIRGANNSTGIALAEVYDLDQTVDSQLANISTRGLVQTGDEVMIGGFIVLGTDFQEVLLRALGPSLPVTGSLADPTLELHDQDGALLASNDNWKDSQEQEIIATGIPPTNDLEAAILITLQPGAYTAIVQGQNNATGIALVEAYRLGNTATAK